ncbi:MAG: DUF3291 domain-containing protein [Pseudomonadota bacterium]
MPVLAHFNIARMKVDWDDPAFADFRDALDPVNADSEAHPGFIWRLKSAEDDSPELVAFENEGWLVNLTAWTDLDSLKAFVRSLGHLAVMRRRGEWFETTPANLVLWWLPEGERPTFEDAMRRRDHLLAHGPGPEAFNFRQPMPPL